VFLGQVMVALLAALTVGIADQQPSAYGAAAAR
jgi:hypothetical protein